MANVTHVPHYGAAYLADALQINGRTRSKESIIQQGKQIAAAATAAKEANLIATQAYFRSLPVHPQQPPQQSNSGLDSYPNGDEEITEAQLAETSESFGPMNSPPHPWDINSHQ